MERSFGSRGEGGAGSAEPRGRAGPEWIPAPEAARSTAGAEPQPEQPEQLQQGRACSSASVSIPVTVGGEATLGDRRLGPPLPRSEHGRLCPAWSQPEHRTGKRSESVSVLTLTVWGPKREKA